jgi:subtilisin family serine protease
VNDNVVLIEMWHFTVGVEVENMENAGRACGLRLLKALLLTAALLQSAPSFAADSSLVSLQHHVDAGRLAQEVKKRIEQDGRTELLIVVEESDILAAASRMRESARLAADSAGIIREKIRLYDRKKGRMLADIPSQDMILHKDYRHFPVMHATVNEKALARLLASPDVVMVSENKAVRPSLTQSLPFIGASQAQSSGATGSGTAVAILDTGLNYTLGAFGYCTAPGVPITCKVAHVQDFAANDGSLDDDGHGTNVAGVVAGVAPDTKLLGLDVFRTDGYAYYSDLLTALDWVLANREIYNIVAVNMSLGGGKYTAPCATDPLATVVTNLKSAGVATVIASGNEKYTNAISAPACIPSAISVGAVYDSNIGSVSWSVCSDYSTVADKVTCFSNSASFLTMLAPGALVNAAGITMTGTSQAAPHVAGAVAVMKGRYPALTVDNVVSRFTGTGVPVPDGRNGIVKPRLALYNSLLFPDAAATPLAYDFGTVRVGSISSVTIFTITNSGMADLSVGSITIVPDVGTTADDFDIRNDYCSGQSLPPAATCTVGVAMTPQAEGGRGALLAIASNDPFSAVLNRSLQGVGSPACTDPPVRIAGSPPAYFASIQAAYDNALPGAILQLQGIEFSGDLTFGRDVNVAVNGGYDCGYTDNVADTRITGKLAIRSGTVVVDKIRVR